MNNNIYPDYRGGSIVNLMSSIIAAYGGQHTDYPPLEQLSPDRLGKTRNLVLVVLDGLGYNYLMQHGKGSVLHQYLRHPITSVAPPTTATAITTFLTGLAPQQHGLTGWFTWFREVGSVLAVLPFKPRCSHEPLGRSGISAEALFGHVPLFDRLEVESYSLCPDWIAQSDFNRAHLGRAEPVPYQDLDDCLTRIAQIARAHDKRKYIYAYWPGFDRLAHQQGIGSDGNVYISDLANNAIGVIDNSREYRIYVMDERLSWPDALSFGPDNRLYTVSNQLHKSALLHGGEETAKPPYYIFSFTPLAAGVSGR